MNHLIYNISVIIIIIGTILVTVYVTRATSNSYINQPKRLGMENEGLRHKYDIYENKINTTYKKLFNDPEIWSSYKSFDTSDQTDKIYVKP